MSRVFFHVADMCEETPYLVEGGWDYVGFVFWLQLSSVAPITVGNIFAIVGTCVPMCHRVAQKV